MEQTKDTGVWKTADIHQLRLIKSWEKAALKGHIAHGLNIIAVIILIYILLVLCIYTDAYENIPIWKAAAMLLFMLICIFSMWGFMIYEEKRAFWGGRIYTRTVTCIGHTIVHYRRGLVREVCYMDIAGADGHIQEHIEIPNIIMESVRHQDKVLAVTNDPGSLYPLRIIPLCDPATARRGHGCL